jgi:spermidine/putrescine transport system ATP-binding protein
VADFLGVSNLMDAVARPDGGRSRVRLGDVEVTAESGDTGARGASKVVIRPERVVIEAPGGTGANRIPGMVERAVYLGPTVQLIVRLPFGASLQATRPNTGDRQTFEQGDPVTVHLPPHALRVLSGPADEAARAGPRAASPSEEVGVSATNR